MSKQSADAKITQYILDNFKANKLPWRREYTINAPSISTPIRHTGEFYRGINLLVLMCSALSSGYTSPHWLTFKQCQSIGGTLKGERGTRIMKFGQRELDSKKANGDPKTSPYVRVYTVFNIEQAKELPDRYCQSRTVAEECEHSIHELVTASGISLLHGHHMGCYYPVVDTIRIPNQSSYDSANAYAATLAHELIHATGHSKRLDRNLDREDDEAIAIEELVAEIGSAMLLARLGIAAELEKRVVPYIAGWIQEIESDPKYILKASAAAQKALDHIFDATNQSSQNTQVAAS